MHAACRRVAPAAPRTLHTQVTRAAGATRALAHSSLSGAWRSSPHLLLRLPTPPPARVPPHSAAACRHRHQHAHHPSHKISHPHAAAASSAATASAGADSDSPRLLAALFDIDGTLTDTERFHFDIWSDVLAPFGVKVTEDLFTHSISGRANALVARDFMPHLSEAETQKLFADKEALFRERSAALLAPVAGLLDFIHHLRAAGVRMAAVTNAPKPNADMMLSTLGLRHLFDTVVLGEECSASKPSPIPYQEGMRRLSLDPHGGVHAVRCVVFEDSLPGVRAGVAAGAVVVGVRTTQTDEVLRAAGCAFTIKDYRNIHVGKLLRDVDDFVHQHDLSQKTSHPDH